MSLGILSKEQLMSLAPPRKAPHAISRPSGAPVDSLEFNASSLDLPLGEQYWVMRGSCRTGRGIRVSDLRRLFAHDEAPKRMNGDTELQKNTVYLFEVDCGLNLQDTKLQGKATARSSIGRLDVLVRLVGEEAPEFDRIRENYNDHLYVEVTPITFNIIVRPGTCLSQLRLFKGSERLVNITKEEFDYEDFFPVIGDERHFASDDPHEVWYPFRLDLSTDQTGCSGFVAKKQTADPIDPTKKNHYDPKDFWEPVHAKDDAIELEPDRLYILRSKERLRLPAHIALECQAYTETMGEWRIEYAGFAHPYFGHSRSEGSPLMFEVRGHNIPTILTDDIPLGNVCFKRMSQSAKPPGEVGQYENQELKLSGCFKNWSS